MSAFSCFFISAGKAIPKYPPLYTSQAVFIIRWILSRSRMGIITVSFVMSGLVDISIDDWHKVNRHPILGSLYVCWNETVIYMCCVTRSLCSIIFCQNDTTSHLTYPFDCVVMKSKEAKVFISEFWRSGKIR